MIRTTHTTDAYPDLTPMEKQVEFLCQRQGDINSQQYFELLKIHLKKENDGNNHIKNSQ